MSDRPVLIPTSEGVVGGIVSEPRDQPQGAIVLLPGAGRPARSGVNAFWTRLARELAEQGLVVLRFDYSREGETLPLGEGMGGQVWKRDLDLRLLEQVAAWLRQRIGRTEILLAGLCSGARLAIELGGRQPRGVAGLFLVVPHLMTPVEASRASGDGLDGSDAVDPLVVDCLRAGLGRIPVWILAGENDTLDLPQLRRRLGLAAADLELEVVPGMALHMLDQPEIHQQVGRRLSGRIARALVEPAAAVT